MNSYTTGDEMWDVRACIATITDRVEDCRERSLAITKLEEAILWLGALKKRQREAEDAALDAEYDDNRNYGENA